MNTLSIAEALGLNPKKQGGEYHSPCPFCGGTHRFIVWPDKGPTGRWWCRQCLKKGDAIALLIEKKGMTYKEACEYVGKELKAYKRSSTPRAGKSETPDFVPREIKDPAELWQAKASAFAEHSHKALLKNAEQLAWLAARGIRLETVKRFKLGWNDKRLWRKRSAWGVPDKTIKDKDGAEKVLTMFALHMGLVIPYIIEGRVHRLRIRRPEEGFDDRYHVIPGSGMAPMMIQPEPLPGKGRGAWAVVESELDAMLIAQDAGDIVGSAGLGSVTTKPDETLGKALSEAACILVSLDSDEAGKKRWPWWQQLYPQSDRWPVPRGKDPGDYRKAGGDIRAWIIAGLPFGLRPAPCSGFTTSNDALKQEADHIAAAGKMVESETKGAEAETKAPLPETTPSFFPSPRRGEGQGEGEDDLKQDVRFADLRKLQEAPGADKRRESFERIRLTFYAEVAKCFPSYDEYGWDKMAWLKANHPDLHAEVERLFARTSALIITGPDKDFRAAAREWTGAYMRAYSLAAGYLKTQKRTA